MDSTLHNSARRWRDDFFQNLRTEPDLPWSDSWRFTPAERALLGPSLAQFQLGEGSSGTTLLTLARAHAQATRDPFYAEAVALFINEEQRHSSLLGRFLRRERVPLIEKHWVDSSFRWIRRQIDLRVMLAVLSAAEVIAVPYYRAVARATSHPLLIALCKVILKEEGRHLRFQASNFARLFHRKPIAWILFELLHLLFLAGTCVVVWRDHGRVLQAGGYSPWSFLATSLRTMSKMHAQAGQTLELWDTEPEGYLAGEVLTPRGGTVQK